MKRREFLAAVAATAASVAVTKVAQTGELHEHASCGLTYASPSMAMHAPHEALVYVPCLYVGTGVHKPDYLAAATSCQPFRHTAFATTRSPPWPFLPKAR